ncbi:hypothetical protein N7454_008195 [Penicillium verhagenii]|nr:hypothetical protein N7454_008195 [Penicillium verhagenii]
MHFAGPFDSELDLNEYLIRPAWSGGFPSDAEYNCALDRAKIMGCLPHRVVFIHGDLKYHDILVKGFTTTLSFTPEDFLVVQLCDNLGAHVENRTWQSWIVSGH